MDISYPISRRQVSVLEAYAREHPACVAYINEVMAHYGRRSISDMTAEEAAVALVGCITRAAGNGRVAA